MHQIYQTEGIVLKSLDFGEANKYLLIFTKEFGLIKVTAQGLRNVSSKLRYGLQEFSVAQLSLVKGRGPWRLTNSFCDENLYFSTFKDTNKVFVLKSVLDLLVQLLPGQDKNEDLYNTVMTALFFLKENNLKEGEVRSFESIIVLRILYCLGYLDKDKEIREGVLYSTFLGLEEWDISLLLKMREDRKRVIYHINKSLQSSQLI